MNKPILLDIPASFESERLIIRSPKTGDGTIVNQAIIESFELLKEWMPWAKEEPSLEDSEEVCRQAEAKYLLREDLMMLLIEKDSGELVGCSGVHRMDWEVGRFEIGYWARLSKAGNGFITESTRRITKLCFEELLANRVEIFADERNEKSWRIPEKLGYKFEGVRRNDSRAKNGELRNTRCYSATSLSELS